MITAKIWGRTKQKTKLITIPSKSGIEIGTYVLVRKLNYNKKLYAGSGGIGIIGKVWLKKPNYKQLTIPKKSALNIGDFVIIQPISCDTEMMEIPIIDS